MRATWQTVVGLAGLVFAAQAAAQVTFYEHEGFGGRSFTVNGPVDNFDGTGFNDRAASVVIDRGRWEACEDAYYQGRCVELRPGNYDSLRSLGMYRNISSVRPLAPTAHAPEAAPPLPGVPVSEYRQRPGERLHEVPIASVHEVVGPPEHRCWVERHQVVEEGGPNVPGAIIGGVIGGILGHQIGSGRGRDVGTVGGAVAGAAIGANVNRGTQAYDRDVQRCTTVPGSAQPDYWDVTYYFRGVEHHVQLSAPPGPTITVNDEGEPRAG
jgi:uncharacterized protein YcfJ